MTKKHFVAPIIEQWIQNLRDPSSTKFSKDNYAMLLEATKEAIDKALVQYNLEKKK